MRKIQKGDRVVVLREITRAEGPYASAGEAGEVWETFQPQQARKGEWCAKVQMDGGGTKTFRVTSLRRE